MKNAVGTFSSKFYAHMQVKSDEIISKILDEQGNSPDGGSINWLLIIAVSVGIIAIIYATLKGWIPTFLNTIFTKIQSFFNI
ncbi:hypothetical protein [Peptoanaerobacter stomatis]